MDFNTENKLVAMTTELDRDGEISRIAFWNETGFGTFADAALFNKPDAALGEELIWLRIDEVVGYLRAIIMNRRHLGRLADFSGLPTDEDGVPCVVRHDLSCAACGNLWVEYGVEAVKRHRCPRCRSIVEAFPSQLSSTGPDNMQMQELWAQLPMPGAMYLSLPDGLSVTPKARGVSIGDTNGHSIGIDVSESGLSIRVQRQAEQGSHLVLKVEPEAITVTFPDGAVRTC